MMHVMRRRGGRTACRAAISTLAAAMAAFMREMCAFTLAMRARCSAKPGLTALQLPKGAPTLPRLRSAFVRASADMSAR
jgi:hypothetical protein